MARTTVAVLGTGSIGMRHVRVLSERPDLRVIAVPARPERAAELRAEGHACARDLAEAAALGARACIVATETGRHLSDGLAALDQGFDVLMEKPLAVDADRAGELAGAAEKRGRLLAVGCVLRFCDSLQIFRERLPRIGEIHGARIECQSYLPEWRPSRPYAESYSARADEGGVLRDLIHEIDYAGWLFGWPASVQGIIRNVGRLGIDAEEAADLLWETEGGAIIAMTLDYLSRPARRLVRAAGELGTIEWDAIAQTVTLWPADGAARRWAASQTREAMLAAEDAAFLKAAAGERADERLATAADGVRALAVCDAARTGRGLRPIAMREAST